MVQVLSFPVLHARQSRLSEVKSSKSSLQGKPDVRLAFIQFVLSFLVSADSAVIGQVLEVKGKI